MDQQRFIAPSAYFMAAILVVFPLSELVITVWPLHFGTTAWRFGAAGLLSRTLMTPLLGILLAAATAMFFGHRKTLRTVGIVSLVLAVLLVAACGLFALDALEMRVQVNPKVKHAFDVATVQAMAKLGICLLWSAVLALGTFKALKKPRGAAKRDRAADRPVLVGSTLMGAAAPPPAPAPAPVRQPAVAPEPEPTPAGPELP